ncbi:MAG: hypothetical protein US69_C0011G0017 [candidate division TM6 bacterium GW2011_GWF2_38_10]|nr:MAG: hypothetical protein US69_C0011G0017 [candidate division TM6 bacterium GW2011_GWF2_38_10]
MRTGSLMFYREGVVMKKCMHIAGFCIFGITLSAFGMQNVDSFLSSSSESELPVNSPSFDIKKDSSKDFDPLVFLSPDVHDAQVNFLSTTSSEDDLSAQLFITNDELKTIYNLLDGKDIDESTCNDVALILSKRKPNFYDKESIELYNAIAAKFFSLLDAQIATLLDFYEKNSNTISLQECNFDFQESLCRLKELHEKLSVFVSNEKEDNVKKLTVSTQIIGTLIHQSIPVIMFLQKQFSTSLEVLGVAAAAQICVAPQASLAKKLVITTMITGTIAITLTYVGNYLGWWVLPAPQVTVTDFMGNASLLLHHYGQNIKEGAQEIIKRLPFFKK